MSDMKGQLTWRGIAIGIVGCIIITASSIYIALRMGALPWPIVFAAIVSLFFLKAVSRGRSTLNEANATHTIMSAGAMVAGGLAFTIPGAWMLGLADEVSLGQLLAIALGGVALGIAATALLRRHFIEGAALEYPIGQAAAETLKAGDSPERTGRKLFGAMGFAGLYALLRDGLGVLPTLLFAAPVPGVAFGIYNSPMSMAVGFLVGTGAVCVWFAGALLGSFGIVVGGSAAGWWDVPTAQGIVSSLGMGVMIGSGCAVIVRDILPQGARGLRRALKRSQDGSGLMGLTVPGARAASGSAQPGQGSRLARLEGGLLALAAAAVVLVASLVLGLPPAVAVAVVALTFVTCTMSSQSVGQSGIDPMEIFGLIVLLLVAAFSDVAGVRLFFIAALVAVACGLAGDVMNDFKAGALLGTSPRAQIAGQAIGGVVGAVVAVAVLQVLLAAFGPGAFGPEGQFVAAQASVVATMVTGIPNMPAFVLGIVAGFGLYLVRFPSMMLGLGIYLPFYMSFTAFIGAMAKVAYEAAMKRRRAAASPEDQEERAKRSQENGLLVASGLLGGESIVGIVLAMLLAGSALLS